MNDSTLDAVTVALCLFLVAVQCGVFGHLAVRLGWCPLRCGPTLRKWRRAAGRSRPAQKHAEDAFVSRTAQRVDEYMRENAQRMWRGMACITTFALVLLATSKFVPSERKELYFNRYGDMFVIVASLVFILLTALPRLSSGRWLLFWYCFSGIFHVAFLVLAVDDSATSEALRTLFFLRLSWALIFPRALWGLLWNGVYAAVAAYRTGWPAGHIIECIALVFIMRTFESSHWARARHEVKETRRSVESTAMLSLLNLVCDVVVELDAAQEIVEHVPRFAAMLAFPAFKTTKGMRLQDFMPHQEDKDAFQRHLSPHAGEEGLGAGALHVRLRDGLSTVINCEIFYVEFVALDNRRHNFAGIREFSEGPPAALPERSPPRPASAAKPGMEHGGRSRGRAAELPKGTVPVLRSQSLQEARRGSSEAALQVLPPGSGPERPGLSSAPLDVEATSTASSSASLASSSMTSRPSAPRFRPTSDMGVDATVVAAMMKWSLPASGRQCCPLHAAVSHLRRCCARLENFPCAPDFVSLHRQQCTRCGVLFNAASGACAVCGHLFPPCRSDGASLN